jgi:hypothetical protein
MVIITLRKKRDVGIDKKDVKFLRMYYSDDNSGLGLSEGAIRGRLFRLREKIKLTLELLSDLAQLLPEDQKSEVFNVTTLAPFIEALMEFDADDIVQENQWLINRRVFGLAGMLLTKSLRGYDAIKNEYTSLYPSGLSKEKVIRHLYMFLRLQDKHPNQ